ncbi:MAG: hypothetical protein LBU91_03810 [Bacteroidales bacterium]|nr:hypothetical protein [Bacteroidales bacterium]
MQAIPVRTYKSILKLGDDESEIERPTLYDLLAFRAIDAWSSGIFDILDNNIFLPDTLILKTYEQLLQLHKKPNDPNVVVPLKLRRMAWLRNQATDEGGDSLYERNLQMLLVDYVSHDVAAQIHLALAKYYNELGKRYNREVSEEYRWEKQKAVQFAEMIVEIYPNSREGKEAQALLQEIQQPSLALEMQSVVLPNKNNLMLMRYANVDTVYASLYRLSSEEWKVFKQDQEVFVRKAIENKKVYKPWQTIVPDSGDYQLHRVELPLEPLIAGHYVMYVSPQKEFTKDKDGNLELPGAIQNFEVSKLSFVSTSAEGQLQGIVVDRETGKPKSGVKVRLFSETYDYSSRSTKTTELGIFKSAKDGRFSYTTPEKNQSVNVELYSQSDTLLSPSNHYVYNHIKQIENWRKQTFLFTDRAIYRPGQTVYFKGIMIERRGDEDRLAVNTSTTVKLMDANYKEVASIAVQTNEYGSFSESFTLPAKGLNGQYHLSAEAGVSYFSVEEYKRPSFEITFDALKDAYQLEQILEVSGVAKTYSGAGLGQSTVKYTVEHSAQYPMWRSRKMIGRPSASPTIVAQGETVCNENGWFSFSFVAEGDKRRHDEDLPIYTFTITAEITDISGETQQAVQTVMVSQKALQVSLDIRPYVNKTKDSIVQVIATNLAGERVPSRGAVKVYRVLPSEQLLHERLWQDPDMFVLSEEEFAERFPDEPYHNIDLEKRAMEFVFGHDYDTERDSAFALKDLSKWVTGEYYYDIQTQDAFGHAVQNTGSFIVYSPQSSKESLNKFYYTIFSKNTFEPGETASWIIGSASKVTVFYEVRSKDGVLAHQAIALNGEQKRIEFPIVEEHRGNLNVQIWCIENNRIYTTDEAIFVPFSNKKIDLSLETFRRILTPNDKETWTLKLLSNDRKPLQGELLLSMYDASLDVFSKSYWNMELIRYYHLASHWRADVGQVQASQKFYVSKRLTMPSPIRYDMLDFTPPYFRQRGLMPLGKMMRAASADVADQVAEVASFSTVSGKAEPATYGKALTSTSNNQSGTNNLPVAARTNLNETAFFYPHLRSDANGEVKVSFTVPESLTRWRIQGLAHTQNLKIGQNEWSVVTQKDLMVYPNVPRFLRVGDDIEFQAKVVNLSKRFLGGKSQLFIDERSLGVVPFSLDPNRSTAPAWSYNAYKEGILDLKFMAESEAHTDGEARLIPVLGNRTLVSETMPLFALPKSEQTYSFDKLAKPQSKTLENYRLTLEITTNPIWFAVQALPELGQITCENSVDVLSAYFANAMAMDILKKNPTIKDVFNRWKALNSETLKSNLETNQELKSVVLEETPWVLDAESETRQKQNIAQYFDENNVQYVQANLLAKLKKLQLPNGGFAWYPGGRDDLWNTQYIVQMIQKLHRRNMEQDNMELQEMLKKALIYCDERHIEMARAKNISPQQKGGVIPNAERNLSPNDIQYLYLRTYFAKDYPISEELTPALVAYDSLAKATWKTQSKYLQGILALYFDLKEDSETVQEIMQNFQRLTLKSSEMGQYWRYQPSWHWYESGIETQAQLIEVYEELGRIDDVAAMQQWLLSQKRTNRWNTTKASVEAVYALLSHAPELSENMDVDIQVGGKKIEVPATADAGSGYFKTFWTRYDIEPKQANIILNNRGNTMVWGGLYWQYFENLDQIKPAATPLSIKKTLFVKHTTDSGHVLAAIPESRLKIGDKVTVRIEIRVDRDMEYVHLKDLRAAAFEPMNGLSGYRNQDGLSYYQEMKDASANFYFSKLPKGTYVFEYDLRTSQLGEFSNGYTTIQCLYAPEFSAQSQGERIMVKD